MAGITGALEPIQISAMDQRQNTSDIFEAKSIPVKVSRIPDEAYALALPLNYIPIASLLPMHRLIAQGGKSVGHSGRSLRNNDDTVIFVRSRKRVRIAAAVVSFPPRILRPRSPYRKRLNRKFT